MVTLAFILKKEVPCSASILALYGCVLRWVFLKNIDYMTFVIFQCLADCPMSKGLVNPGGQSLWLPGSVASSLV